MDKTERKQQIIDLWQACFHDTDAFVNLYFSQKYKDENAMTIVEDGRVLSALQMIPYTATCWGKEFSMSYIAGASTWPDVRGRGLMSNLLLHSFRQMYGRSVAFTALIPAEPWLFQYYSRFGYAPAYYTQDIYYTIPVDKNMSEQDEAVSLWELYEYFSRKNLSRICCVQHDWPDFNAIVKDFESEGGEVITVMQENKICAMAFALYDGKQIFLPEWMYDDEAVKEALLQKCAVRFKCGKIVCRISGDETGKIYGMARIIRLQDMLTGLAKQYSALSCTLQVSDTIIPENDGLYVIENGTCVKNPLNPTLQTMNIDSISRMLLLGGNKNGHCNFPLQQPFMSLMFS